MCTAVSVNWDGLYFGRNLDYEKGYGECVLITPAGFEFKRENDFKTKYKIIGMAHMEEEYPLYYDAANEKGLCIAGLNFVGNAKYQNPVPGKENITQYEFIPWLLGNFESVDEFLKVSDSLNITGIPFSEKMPPAQLHWLISDKENCITLECRGNGINIIKNKAGVLTNNPPFEYQMYNLSNYMSVTAEIPENRFSEKLGLTPYSRGMGGIGLPGDLSSESRFVRAAFVKENSICGNSESEKVTQFFKILDSVSQQRGCCKTDNGYEITIYSSCFSLESKTYYYKTYGNSRIKAVKMTDADKLETFEVREENQDILYQN